MAVFPFWQPLPRILVTILIFSFVTLRNFTPVLAQKNHGYIATDSSLITGNVTLLGKGKYEFRHHRKSKPIVFGPNDIREYGDGGNEYESLLVDGERTFYQRVTNGPVKLFRNKKSYLLGIDDSLIFLTKGNYRSLFQQILVCEGGSSLVNTVSYTSRSMGNYVSRANKAKCTSANLPYRRIGIYMGYNLMNFEMEFSKVNAFTDNAKSFTGGIFFDLPLYKAKSLFLSTELLVTSLKSVYYNQHNNRTEYAGIDMTGIVIPLGVKWLLSNATIRTYLKTGATVSYFKFNSLPEYFATTTNGDIVEVLAEEITADNSLQVGFDAAAGLEIPIGNRKNIHIECKYINAFDGSANSSQMNWSGLFFITGINF